MFLKLSWGLWQGQLPVAKRFGTTRRRRPLLLESLEDRVLLSGGTGLSHPTYVLFNPKGHGSPDGGSVPLSSALTPAKLRKAYGLDQLAQDGLGVTIAIIDAYDNPKFVSSTASNFNSSDLHQFDLQYNLPEPAGFFTKVDQNGGTSYPGTDPSGGWEAEEALDVEWVHALAPQAKIILVEATDSSTGNLISRAANWAGSSSGAAVVTMSFGTNGEFSGETTSDSNFTSPASHGVTFLASTGDDGAPGGYPAYSPKVVAVGGTILTRDSNGNWSSETGWGNNLGSSGGGISKYETQPAYQSGVTPSSTKRTIPDVAFDADPNSGVSVYDSYNGDSTGGPWYQFGGTSLSSPCWAALVAIADQIRAGHGQGSLDGPSQTLPTLYNLYRNATAYARDFHDIKTGTSLGSPHYTAVTGYDLVTGIGSPIANKLLPDLAGAAVTSVTTTTANGSYLAGSVITINVPFSVPVTVTGTPRLSLNSGGTASYTSGSGTSTLVFTYTVAAGENSSQLDYTSTTALSLNGGTIKDSAGNAAVLTLATPGAAGSLAANSNIVIDTVAPTVANVTSSTANGIYGAGSTISIQVGFSETVNVTGTPLLALNSGGTASFTSGSGTSTLTFTYTVASGEATPHLDYPSTSALSLNGGTIKDSTGNPANLTLPADGSGHSLADNTTIAIVGPADHLVFAVQPGNGVSWEALTPAVKVLVVDQYGTLETADNSDLVTLTVASGPGTCSAGSTTTVTVSGGVATFSNLALTAAGTYTLGETATGGLTGANSASFSVSPEAIALAQAPQINGDLPGLSETQRSRVNDIVYRFNHPVTLSANAFSIALHANVTVNGTPGQTAGTLPTLNYSSTDGGFTWVVTFSGDGVVGGSIADGAYDITLNAGAVSDADGQTLSASRTDTFFRLYGDSNGDQVVNAADNFKFKNAFGTSSGDSGYLAYFDSNDDGIINAADNFQFKKRFGVGFSGFTPTI